MWRSGRSILKKKSQGLGGMVEQTLIANFCSKYTWVKSQIPWKYLRCEGIFIVDREFVRRMGTLSLAAPLVLLGKSILMPAPDFPFTPPLFLLILIHYTTIQHIYSSYRPPQSYSCISYCNMARWSGAEIENASQFHLYPLSRWNQMSKME